MNAEIIKQAAEKEIACHPDQKNIRFKIDDTIFWIKRIYDLKSMIPFSGSKESTAIKETG